MEVSVISVVDVDNHLGYSLSVEQTLAQMMSTTSQPDKNNQRLKSGKTTADKRKSSKHKQSKPSRLRQLEHNQEPEATRIDFYLEQLKAAQPYLPKAVQYLVGDGNYSSYKFVSGVVALELEYVGKLRIDADRRYLYHGCQKQRGAKRKFDGKVKLTDVTRLSCVRARPAEWQEADYVVSNPPFLVDKRMKNILGDEYVSILRKVNRGSLEACDFVMFWWNKAAYLLTQGQLQSFGFITNNTITQIFNRRVLDKYLNQISITFAIPDHPWVSSNYGAAVRIAMTVAVAGRKEGLLAKNIHEDINEEGISNVFFQEEKGFIYSNLSVKFNYSKIYSLASNSGIGNKGVTVLSEGFFLSVQELQLLSLFCHSPKTFAIAEF